jgi:hypothetical protein
MAYARRLAEIGKAKLGSNKWMTHKPIMQERRDYKVQAGSAVVVSNNFPLYELGMAPTLWRDIRRAGKAILADIKGVGPHAAPIDTGALRDSYHMTESRSEWSITIENDEGIAHYAPFVELGSPTIYHPHLRPATVYHFNQFKSEFSRVLHKIHDDNGIPYNY